MYDICLKDTFHIVQFAGTTFCLVAIFSRFQALSDFSLNNNVILKMHHLLDHLKYIFLDKVGFGTTVTGL